MIKDAIKTLDPDDLSQPELHNYLLSAVAPRPICFASTVDKEGNVNLSPFSFFNVFSSNPPIMIFSPARSGIDNTTKHTYDNIKEVGQVVINIVNFPMVEQMSLASTAYPKGVNEFEKAGFTPVNSEKVKPPRVKESPVSFECEVDRVIELGDGPGAGNLILARVVLMHIREEYIDVNGQLDTEKLDLIGRMGGIWYSRANKEALFEIPKPIRTKGIGVDQLPEGIRTSKVLTGNNLGRLGNVESFPSRSALKELNNEQTIQNIIKKNLDNDHLRHSIHLVAKGSLEKGETVYALKLLLWVEQYLSDND